MAFVCSWAGNRGLEESHTVVRDAVASITPANPSSSLWASSYQEKKLRLKRSQLNVIQWYLNLQVHHIGDAPIHSSELKGPILLHSKDIYLACNK